MRDCERVLTNMASGGTQNMRLFKRDKTFTEPIVWLTTFFVIAFHVGAVAALFTFAWKPFALAIL